MLGRNNIISGVVLLLDILKCMLLFCKAIVEVLWHILSGGNCYGDGNIVFIVKYGHITLLPVHNRSEEHTSELQSLV